MPPPTGCLGGRSGLAVLFSLSPFFTLEHTNTNIFTLKIGVFVCVFCVFFPRFFNRSPGVFGVFFVFVFFNRSPGVFGVEAGRREGGQEGGWEGRGTDTWYSGGGGGGEWGEGKGGTETGGAVLKGSWPLCSLSCSFAIGVEPERVPGDFF